MYYKYDNLIAPGIPGDLFVNEINSTAITVTWEEPLVTNGNITLYQVFYSLGNHTVIDVGVDMIVVVDATMNTRRYEVDIFGLDHFTTYTVAVRARTRIGFGNLTETFSILTDPFSKYITSYSCIVNTVTLSCSPYPVIRTYTDIP